MNKVYENYLIATKKALSEQLEYIQSIVFPKIQYLENLQISDEVFKVNANSIQNKFNLPPKGNQIIYVIRIKRDNLNKNQLAGLIGEIQKLKESQKTYKTRITCINRLNIDHHINSDKDIIFYVGSSKFFAQRLKEHVGFGSRDTATILLKMWSPLIDGKVRLTVDYFDFGPLLRSESAKLIEFDMSRDLKPLMGRNRKA